VTALDRHRALLAGMTGSRWVSEGAGVYVDEAYEWTHGPTTVASCTSYGNASLIAAAVNAHPLLLDLWAAAKKLDDVMDRREKLPDMEFDKLEGEMVETIQSVRDILAKLEAMS